MLPSQYNIISQCPCSTHQRATSLQPYSAGLHSLSYTGRNFVTREMFAHWRNPIGFLEGSFTDTSTLQLNLILVVSSGPRQKTQSELQIKADFCFVTVTRQRNALCPYCFVISLKHLTARIGQMSLKRLL